MSGGSSYRPQSTGGNSLKQKAVVGPEKLGFVKIIRDLIGGASPGQLSGASLSQGSLPPGRGLPAWPLAGTERGGCMETSRSLPFYKIDPSAKRLLLTGSSSVQLKHRDSKANPACLPLSDSGFLCGGFQWREAASGDIDPQFAPQSVLQGTLRPPVPVCWFSSTKDPRLPLKGRWEMNTPYPPGT